MRRYTARIAKSALKQLTRLPKEKRRRLFARIESLACNPRPKGVTKLQSCESLYRLRVGDHRIIYTIKDRELLVLVVKIAHRRDVYR